MGRTNTSNGTGDRYQIPVFPRDEPGRVLRKNAPNQAVSHFGPEYYITVFETPDAQGNQGQSRNFFENGGPFDKRRLRISK